MENISPEIKKSPEGFMKEFALGTLSYHSLIKMIEAVVEVRNLELGTSHPWDEAVHQPRLRPRSHHSPREPPGGPVGQTRLAHTGRASDDKNPVLVG